MKEAPLQKLKRLIGESQSIRHGNLKTPKKDDVYEKATLKAGWGPAKRNRQEGHDRGHWNIKGILSNTKAEGRTPIKYKNHEPEGKAAALAKKLKEE